MIETFWLTYLFLSDPNPIYLLHNIFLERSEKYTLDYFVDYGTQLVEAGAHILGIKV